MKIYCFIFLFLAAALQPVLAHHGHHDIDPVEPPTEGGGQGRNPYCGNDPSESIDYGNFMYLPNENSEMLILKIN